MICKICCLFSVYQNFSPEAKVTFQEMIPYIKDNNIILAYAKKISGLLCRSTCCDGKSRKQSAASNVTLMHCKYDLRAFAWRCGTGRCKMKGCIYASS